MSFVNEKLTQEALEQARDRIPLLALNLVRMRAPLYMWTIDRVREAALLITNSKSGGYDGTTDKYDFLLMLESHGVMVTAIPEGRKAREGGYILDWTVTRLILPASIEGRLLEVQSLLHEALACMGYYYGKTPVGVDVHYQPAFLSLQQDT